MNCFPCFGSNKSESLRINDHLPVVQAAEIPCPALPSNSLHAVHDKHKSSISEGGIKEVDVGDIAAQTFTFRELATATKNFRQECLIGDGGFGKIYKGTLQPSGQVVAVKRLDRNGTQGNKEFLVEVFMLSLLKHKNLLNLVGYCADGDQRLLVYEYMPLGSLDAHLFDMPEDNEPLDWAARMKIASGAAQGLEYLHEKANTPVVYRDMKASNILLGEGYEARLSDYGLANFAHSGDKCSTPSRVMNTYGYCAPEYTSRGELTVKSDIYSFGVVLLELITGRRAMDPNRPSNEQNLVTWAHSFFKDPKRFPEMADPHLNGNFSVKSLNQAVGIAAMCLEEEPSVRPYITDVVGALSFLEMAPKEPATAASTTKLPAPIPPLKENHHCDEDDDKSDHSSAYSSADHEEDEDDRQEKNDSEHETDHDERSSSSDDQDDDDEEEEESSSEKHQSNTIHPADDNIFSESDEDDHYEIPKRQHRKSLKWQSKSTNAEPSDDESTDSSSVRTSVSSSADEE